MVSIIVVNKDQNPYLEESIHGCLELDYPDFEIIVVTEGGFKFYHPQVKVVSTDPLSPPEKRDLALEYTTGELIAFIDADAYPKRDWLKIAVRNFGEKEIAAVGGPGATPSGDNFWQKASGTVLASLMVGGTYGYRFIPKAHREVDDYPLWNLLVRKAVLKKVGGFNTNIWPGDDTILCLKVTNHLKKRVLYDPDAIVYHHRQPLFIPHLKQIKKYALHRGYFVKKYPQTSLKLPYFLPSLFTIGLLLGWVTWIIAPGLTHLYLLLAAGYISLALLTGLKTLNLKMALAVFVGIFLTHIVYGIWFIKGLLTRKLPQEKDK